MKNIINKIKIKILAFLRNRIMKRDNKKRIKYEEICSKELCDKHSDQWVDLDPSEEKMYKNQKHTYKVFKNLSEQFNEYPQYYLTDAEYVKEILPRLSRFNHTAGENELDSIFNDKNYFERFFPELKFPKAIARCIGGSFYDENYNAISVSEVKEKLRAYGEVVFKKSLGTEHGNGVQLISYDKYEEALNNFGKNYVIQELIKQHRFLAGYNSSSVNIIRIITVFWKGSAYVIDSRLRIGAPGSFCDHLGFAGKNPLEIGVAEDGTLIGRAFDDTDGVYYSKIFGKETTGKIPGYEQMLNLAVNGQALYPAYGILGWDFTVEEDGSPLCMEVNSKHPAIKAGQCVNGPIFMKKTVDGNPLLDEIMSEPIRYGSMPLL